MKRIFGFALFLSCAITLCLCPASLAQSTSATITGRVADPSKAVIVKVHVTAINTETNTRFETFTNDSGVFALPNLLLRGPTVWKLKNLASKPLSKLAWSCISRTLSS